MNDLERAAVAYVKARAIVDGMRYGWVQRDTEKRIVEPAWRRLKQAAGCVVGDTAKTKRDET